MSGLIGKKIGMTSVYTADGISTACTILEVGPCYVTQVRSEEVDGYKALQLSYGDKKEKNVSAPLLGHFKKANVSPKHVSIEFKYFTEEYGLGEELTVDSVFEEGEFVDVAGKSKGKGFQGVVKRHGFGGVGQSTHGQHNRLRAPGAIGACSTPSRVFKGMRMAGRDGGRRVKIQNLEILKVIKEKNLLVVKGAVPGAKNSYVIIEK